MARRAVARRAVAGGVRDEPGRRSRGRHDRAATLARRAVRQRHPGGVVRGPPPSAASAIVSTQASRVIIATRSAPDVPARPRYTKEGGRPPVSWRRPSSPVCVRPRASRVASVAAEPSIRRFHSGSWPRQTRTVGGSAATGAASARSRAGSARWSMAQSSRNGGDRDAPNAVRRPRGAVRPRGRAAGTPGRRPGARAAAAGGARRTDSPVGATQFPAASRRAARRGGARVSCRASSCHAS